MKQTAVEWLEQEMLKPNLSMKEILEQAKEMEKQQIADAFNEGWLQCNIYGLPEKSRKHFETPVEYYNETFKKK